MDWHPSIFVNVIVHNLKTNLIFLICFRYLPRQVYYLVLFRAQSRRLEQYQGGEEWSGFIAENQKYFKKKYFFLLELCLVAIVILILYGASHFININSPTCPSTTKEVVTQFVCVLIGGAIQIIVWILLKRQHGNL